MKDGLPTNQRRVRPQNTGLSTAREGEAPTNRLKPRNPEGPSSCQSWRGRRMCTIQVWRYPLCQRERCLIQLTKSLLASSYVVESRISTVYPSRWRRIPRSASSVTLYGSQPPTALSASRRKWFDVPPRGTGALAVNRAGRNWENQAPY